MTTNINEALRLGRQRLRESPTPQLDAQVLLCQALRCTRAHLVAHAERVLTTAQRLTFEAALARRARGEPVAHIVGYREFWSLEFRVSPATLIPRPDTETLVETALGQIDPSLRLRVLELGTGSGAIAVVLATERPLAAIVATDVSRAALAVARDNGARHAPGRIDWRQGRWWEAVSNDAPFDLIVSNPPYVAENDPHLERGDLRFEPSSALCAGPDGLGDLRLIVGGAGPFLGRGGALMVEHGADQADAVAALFQAAGFTDVACARDLAGQPRVTFGRRG